MFKKETGVRRIAGLMMLHYFQWPWCLDELMRYADEVYLLLHFSPGYKADWPRRLPGVTGIVEVSVDAEWQVMEWRRHQGDFRERLLRLLDASRPDLVLFPDEDEAYPEPGLLVKDLERLWRSKKDQLAFKRCNFWDSMETVRKDRWIYYGPHVKAYKWKPGLSYLPYLGYNRVNPFGRRRLCARAVMRHYAYMERSERERRFDELYREKQDRFRGLMTVPKLVKYTDARRAPGPETGCRGL